MFEIKGLDKFQKKLDTLARNARALDGHHQVSVTELLTPAFVSKHTRFSSVDELFGHSEFQIESSEDFKAIPDDEWDTYIRSISSFSDWKAMLSEASAAWAAKKLGL